MMKKCKRSEFSDRSQFFFVVFFFRTVLYLSSDRSVSFYKMKLSWFLFWKLCCTFADFSSFFFFVKTISLIWQLTLHYKMHQYLWVTLYCFNLTKECKVTSFFVCFFIFFSHTISQPLPNETITTLVWCVLFQYLLMRLRACVRAY